MIEVWLRPNRRAICLAMIPQAALFAFGLWILWAIPGLARFLGLAIIAIPAFLIGAMVYAYRRPVLAYAEGFLLLYLRLGPPIRVPIEIVEGFFLGSGPLKLTDTDSGKRSTVNLVVRLAEKATEWASVPVKPALAQWAESYISIRGTWSEPLTLKVVERLNVRLHEVQRGSGIRG